MVSKYDTQLYAIPLFEEGVDKKLRVIAIV